ncbi:GNAT family N-acetyltransferase [Deinococcus radiophilus]|uniref:GNAT family N-acetyltransferase n=1 Tax=Deinococcus radiophilus TaxID=32062 RepID=A0A3S0IRI4_9DEIO|nr:GNAT family N-acetyltransferase [Deinococcus radiophilus]RTR29874.1 GNAT family N-acetyltransferase [Deinococcus radiophilus]UFA49774.1 GNAT family N-acetyltransferase [Deinococcus radiophilus]
MTLSIRRAGLSDLDTLTELFDEYRVWYSQPSDPAGARAFLQERLLLGEAVIFLALVDDQPAGFMQLYRMFSSVGLRRIRVLNDLFVRDGFRGQHIGTALLDAARDLTAQSGAARVVLETGADNHAAQQVYERYGFTRDESVHYLLPVEGR